MNLFKMKFKSWQHFCLDHGTFQIFYIFKIFKIKIFKYK